MEGLMRQVDGYCERTDFSYWAEPVNALTNLAFIVAAIVMWRRVRGQGLPLAEVLCAILFAIGVGSWLFHTHATLWGALADVIPIGLYILTYLFAVNFAFCTFSKRVSLVATALFIPYAAVLTLLLDRLPFFNVSNFYWTVPILIFGYALALRRSSPDTARGMAIGGAVLCVSITARSLDETLCDAFPLGTHFLWHLLNGAMLGWMIEVYRRHRLAQPARAA